MVGYVQATQFDLDRWTIGLTWDSCRIVEVPAFPTRWPRRSGQDRRRQGKRIPARTGGAWSRCTAMPRDRSRSSPAPNLRNGRIMLIDAEGRSPGSGISLSAPRLMELDTARSLPKTERWLELQMNVSNNNTVLAAIAATSVVGRPASRRIRNTAFLGACSFCGAARDASGIDAGCRTGRNGLDPSRESTMGWDGPEARYDEGPAHRVHVDGFFMDATEVTNAQFRAFVEATGYRTTAERPVDWEQMKKQVAPGTPKPPEELLVPGALVFTSPDGPPARRRERVVGPDDRSELATAGGSRFVDRGPGGPPRCQRLVG